MLIVVPHAKWMVGRTETLARLLGQLGTVSKVFPSERKEPCWTWTRRLWEWCAQYDEHVVCLEDDVEVCPDFVRVVSRVIDAAPNEMISLHCAAPAALRLANEGAHWCRSYWLTGPAHVLPPGLARELLDFWDSVPWDVAARLNNDNIAIHYAWSKQRPILATIPALARHDESVPSSFGYDSHLHRGPSVPWTAYPVPATWGPPTDAFADNPWCSAAHMTEFRRVLREGVSLCSACLSSPAIVTFGPSNVALCRQCSKRIAIAHLGAVL